MSKMPIDPAVPSEIPTPSLSPATAARSHGPTFLQLIVVAAVLGIGVVVTAWTADVTRTSEPGIRVVDDKPFLAATVGDWTGDELRGLSEAERKVLPADTEGARRIYTDSEGNQVYCSVVLAGRDVTSIHRPELCLPGQGWIIQKEFVETILVPSADGGKLGVQRMDTMRDVPLRDGGTAQLQSVFAYWFVGKDRVTPYHWQRILWTTKDRVLHNVNHRWAYFLIETPARVNPDHPDIQQAENDAMQLLARFVQDLYPTVSAKPD